MNLRKPVLCVFLFTFLMVGLIAPVAAARPTGNGAISGRHYTLNLLGKDWEHAEDSELINNGHRIFVQLGADGAMKRTRIQLIEGDDFAVLDADGTDGKATFQLPDPGDVIDESADKYNPDAASYLVFIRVLGKPQGIADMYSVYIDEFGNEWISTEVVTLRQSGGKVNRDSPPKFEDVTKELTTIYLDSDGDGVMERYKLFDDMFEEFFWYYDNQGIRHAQLRFYPVA